MKQQFELVSAEHGNLLEETDHLALFRDSRQGVDRFESGEDLAFPGAFRDNDNTHLARIVYILLDDGFDRNAVLAEDSRNAR